MDDRSLVELRCSAIVFQGDTLLLLLRRHRGDAEEWILPGGHPRPGEGVGACVRREVLEETGLEAGLPRVAFLLEATDPDRDRRLIEVVFLMEVDRGAVPRRQEPDREPLFEPVDATADLALRPPIAGYLRGLARSRPRATAPYLGNLWRAEPDRDPAR